MADSSTGKNTTAGGTEPEPKKTGRRRSSAAVISEVIRKFQEKLGGEEFKPTVAEYLRLLQFEKDVKDEQPREVKITWVEPVEKENVTEK